MNNARELARKDLMAPFPQINNNTDLMDVVDRMMHRINQLHEAIRDLVSAHDFRVDALEKQMQAERTLADERYDDLLKLIENL